MRHLERTHGISIASLHEHFQRDHFILIYEITAKMAADIHTKGFKNPLAWKKACWLINLSEEGDLGSQELYDLVQPSTDVDTTTRQAFQSRTDDIPNFPYTETPVLPPQVYVKGMTGKMGLQCIPGADPIFVIKTPVLFRSRPPGLPVPPDVLRSTWVLQNGVWTQLEDRVSPPAQAQRFERFVERACFQYHSPDGKPLHNVTVPSVQALHRQACSNSGAHRARCGDIAPRACPFQQNSDKILCPRLQFSTEALFTDNRIEGRYRTLHEVSVPSSRVINTLLRLVHGGSHGPGAPQARSFSTHECSTVMNEQSDIEDLPIERSYSRREVKQNDVNKDYWEWEDDETLVRVHETPRRI